MAAQSSISNSNLNFKSSVLNQNLCESVNIATEIVKNEITTSENIAKNSGASVYLIWSFKKQRSLFSSFKNQIFKSVSCHLEKFTVDNVICNDELAKLSFIVVFVAQNKEDVFEEFLFQYGFSNFTKTIDLTDSVYDCLMEKQPKSGICFDKKGIVAKNFKEILHNIVSGCQSLIDNPFRDRIELIHRYMQNDSIRRKVLDKLGFWFLDPEYELLYPYFSAKLRSRSGFFLEKNKIIGRARIKAYLDLLEITDIDANQVDGKDIKFSASYKLGRINKKSSDQNPDPDKLPCAEFAKKFFLKEVKQREIKLEKFNILLSGNPDNRNGIVPSAKYDARFDYSDFFEDEYIRPYWLAEDPIFKEYTNLEYFFVIRIHVCSPDRR